MPSDERSQNLAVVAGAPSDPLALLRTFRTVVWAAFDEHARLTGSNQGFAALAPLREGTPDPERAARVFTAPTIGELLARPPDAQGIVHRGLLTVTGANERPLSLRGAAARRGAELLVLAEHALEETQEALDAVLRLNEELADTQRELVLARRRLEAREEALKTLAATDALTGLTNRRAFLDHLAAATQRVTRGHAAALLMLDVDDFKATNDRWGHAIGDAHLLAVAHAMRASIRAYDVPARLAGDEFVVILPDATLADATEVAGRLLAAARTPRGADVPDGVALSIGVIVLRDGEAANEALKRVDRALYAAKHAGRGRVVAADDRPPTT
jgi:diguanylate cyclase (GGDEF)-like protein